MDARYVPPLAGQHTQYTYEYRPRGAGSRYWTTDTDGAPVDIIEVTTVPAFLEPA